MLLFRVQRTGFDVAGRCHTCYICVTMGECSFFCLETKERTKEKFKAYFFLLLASCTTLKGRNSLRSNSLPFLTLRYGRSLDGEKSRPGEPCGGATGKLCRRGLRWGCDGEIFMIVSLVNVVFNSFFYVHLHR